MIEIKNFINGELKDSFSKKKFNIESPFYKFIQEIPNSDQTDLSLALSATKKSLNEVNKLNLADRVNILKKAAKEFNVTEEEIEYAVKVIGVQKKNIIKKTESIKYIFNNAYEFSKKRYNYLVDEFLYHRLDNNSLIYKKPLENISCCFLPGNDISVAAFVISHVVIAGTSIIIKASKEEPYFAIKIASLITKLGYPKGAINVLLWDTDDKTRKSLAYSLIDNTEVRIIFGDDSTLQYLRYENNGNKVIEHGKNGKFVLYGTGRSKSIVDKNINIKEVAKNIIEASLSYYIGCTSNKAVLVSEEIYDDFKQEILTQIKALNINDPLNEDTDIGYAKDIEKVIKRLNEAKRFSAISILSDVQLKNKLQTNEPILIEVFDKNSEFLKNEYPVPIIALFKYKGDFENAVNIVNELSFIDSVNNKSLVVSVYSKKIKDLMLYIKKINANHININLPTSYQNLALPHQSVYLSDVFTQDVSVTIEYK